MLYNSTKGDQIPNGGTSKSTLIILPVWIDRADE